MWEGVQLKLYFRSHRFHIASYSAGEVGVSSQSFSQFIQKTRKERNCIGRWTQYVLSSSLSNKWYRLKSITSFLEKFSPFFFSWLNVLIPCGSSETFSMGSLPKLPPTPHLPSILPPTLLGFLTLVLGLRPLCFGIVYLLSLFSFPWGMIPLIPLLSPALYRAWRSIRCSI